MIKSYRDLIVWQKSIQLVLEIYTVSRSFPVEERFGLTVQLRRAAISIPANIAEGHGRHHHRAEYRRFLSIARGSVKEVETYLVIAHHLTYVTGEATEAARTLTDEISRMLAVMQKRLAA